METSPLERVRKLVSNIDAEMRGVDDLVEGNVRKASEQRKIDNLREQRAFAVARLQQLEHEERGRQIDADAHVRLGTRYDTQGAVLGYGGFGRGADTVYGRGSGQSYFKDLALLAMPGDPRGFEAQARLAEHSQMIDRAASDLPKQFRAGLGKLAAGRELRVNPNRTDGQGGYAVPPLWVMDEWIAALRAGRAIADRCRPEDLPGGTDSVNLPKMATGTTTAIQTADAAVISSTDFTDTYVSGPVRTIAGQQDISQQLLDQSPLNLDEVLFRDLIADYNQKLDLQVISGSGVNGQMKGLLSVAGTNAVTYTDATPTGSEMFSPIGGAASQVARLRFANADTIAMTPQHWWWIATSVDGSGRPLVQPTGVSGGMNTLAVLDPNASEGLAGYIAGIPVVVDPNLPVNLGAGTNQAPVLVGRFSDFYLYEGAMRTRALVEVLSGTLQVRLQAFNYAALIADRYPTALSVITGTGCIVPSGF